MSGPFRFELLADQRREHGHETGVAVSEGGAGIVAETTHAAVEQAVGESDGSSDVGTDVGLPRDLEVAHPDIRSRVGDDQRKVSIRHPPAVGIGQACSGSNLKAECLRVPFEVADLDDVQHLTGVATPAGGDLRPFPKNMVAWSLVDDARMDFIVETSKRLGIAHTPTLVAGDRLRAMQDYASLRESPDAKLLPRFYRDVVWSPSEGLPVLRRLEAGDFPVLKDAGERGVRLVQRLHAAGVPIFAGSDTQNPFVVPGAGLWREGGFECLPRAYRRRECLTRS